MRCIGTLEFVSDFYNKCHQTQRQLLSATEQSQKFVKKYFKTDSDSNKENISPIDDSTKSELTRKTLIAAESMKFEESKASRRTVTRPGRKTNLIKSKLERAREIKHEDQILNKASSFQRCKATLQRGQDSSPIPVTCHKNSNRDGLKQFTVALERRRGRKNNTPIVTCSMSTRGKLRKNNKAVSMDLNSLKNAAIKSNKAIEKQKVEEGILSCTTEFTDKQTTENSWNENTNSQFVIERFLDAPEDETHTLKSKADMIKVENFDSNDMLSVVRTFNKTENFDEVPYDITSALERPTRELNAKSATKSPQPGDEAGESQIQNHEEMAGQGMNNSSKNACVKEIETEATRSTAVSSMRKTLIESLENVKTIKDIEHDLFNQNVTEIKMNSSNDNNAVRQRNNFNVINALMQPQNMSMSDTFNGIHENNMEVDGNYPENRKKSNGQFGRLSDLITKEQKEIIETLYSVNMGVVNDEEVYRNIKILDKINVKCEICGKTYPRLDKCQVHVWGHLNMKPFCCKSCNFVTLTVSNIRCHIRKRHLKIKPFRCNLCEKTYGTAVLLEEHINSHTGAKPYKCKICNFATSNRQVLSYHKTTHKPAKDISCEVCSKKFFSNCRMRAHMIVHNKDRNLMCKLCSTYLCNVEALEKHYQKVHSRDYVCEICGLRTRSRKALTNHENVHLAAKFRCPFCSNVYKSKHMLKEHILKHQGIRKYKCELCQKSFAQQSHIAAHMSVHMGKRYPCPGCNKLFNRRDNMRIHTRRCEIFKSNPDMEKLWINRKSTSKPLVASGVTAKSANNLKTDEGNLETDSGLVRTNLLTGETDYSNSSKVITDSRNPRAVISDQHFEQVKSNEGDILRIGEVEIVPLSNLNSVDIQNEGGDTVITENVLRPECF